MLVYSKNVPLLCTVIRAKVAHLTDAKLKNIKANSMKNLKFLIVLVLILMLSYVTVYGIKNQQDTATTDQKHFEHELYKVIE